MERRHAINILQALLRLAVGGLFIYAGALKATDPARFADDVEAYRIVSYRASAALAIYLPWLEMICGAGLIVDPLRRGATIILMSLTAIFILAAGSAWMRGLDISCGCFGPQSPHMHAAVLIARNVLILAALAATGWIPPVTCKKSVRR